MRYYKTKNKKKIIPIIVLVVILLTLTLIFGYFLFKNNRSDSRKQVAQQQTEQQESAKPETKQQDSDINNGGEEPKYSPPEEPTTVVSPSTAVSTSIDSFAQSGDMINIQASVTGLDSGSCQFKFSAEDGSTLFKTTNITQKKCSLSISALEFVYIGKWSAINTVNGVSSAPKEANIQ